MFRSTQQSVSTDRRRLNHVDRCHKQLSNKPTRAAGTLAVWLQKSEREEKPQRGRENQQAATHAPRNQPAISALTHAQPHCTTSNTLAV